MEKKHTNPLTPEEQKQKIENLETRMERLEDALAV
jgi:hypothetical protein